MRSVNRSTLMGHIVSKPELSQTKSGKPVTTLSLATNNEWLDQEGTLQKSVDFHRVVLWDKLAESCVKHLDKGTPVYLEGRLTTRRYMDKNEMAHYVTEVIAQTIHILRYQSDKKTVESEELAVL